MPRKPAPLDLDALAARFMARFRGLARFHGHSWITSEFAPPGEKVEAGGKGVHEPVTQQHWRDHLLGLYGVGQTPITDEGTCCFGAIDVDVYDGLDHTHLATQLDVLRLPLTVVKSKSGGAHLYLFLREAAKADLVRGKLMDWAVALGFPRVEVYPKQTRLAGLSDVGNWLNMPYFGAVTPDGSTRVAVLQSGDVIRDPVAFMDHADGKAVSAAELAAVVTPMDERHKDLLQDAPPCLQSLAVKGFGKGERNNALYNLGVYAQKRFPDDWQDTRLDTYNTTFVDPPLPSKEVQAISKSLSKKNYMYRCSDGPIVHACNKQICLTRKHGIGQGTDDPGVAFGPLQKINSQPPIWLWDVNGQRIQLTTEDLMNQIRFNRRVVDELNVWPMPVKGPKWTEIIRDKLKQVEIIDAPPETTILGRLESALVQFLTARRIGTEFVDINRGHAIIYKERVWFHMPTFHLWLKTTLKLDVSLPELWAQLRLLKADAKQQRCGDKTLQLCNMPVPDGVEPSGHANGSKPTTIEDL